MNLLVIDPILLENQSRFGRTHFLVFLHVDCWGFPVQAQVLEVLLVVCVHFNVGAVSNLRTIREASLAFDHFPVRGATKWRMPKKTCRRNTCPYSLETLRGFFTCCISVSVPYLLVTTPGVN